MTAFGMAMGLAVLDLAGSTSAASQGVSRPRAAGPPGVSGGRSPVRTGPLARNRRRLVPLRRRSKTPNRTKRLFRGGRAASNRDAPLPRGIVERRVLLLSMRGGFWKRECLRAGDIDIVSSAHGFPRLARPVWYADTVGLKKVHDRIGSSSSTDRSGRLPLLAETRLVRKSFGSYDREKVRVWCRMDRPHCRSRTGPPFPKPIATRWAMNVMWYASVQGPGTVSDGRPQCATESMPPAARSNTSGISMKSASDKPSPFAAESSPARSKTVALMHQPSTNSINSRPPRNVHTRGHLRGDRRRCPRPSPTRSIGCRAHSQLNWDAPVCGR